MDRQQQKRRKLPWGRALIIAIVLVVVLACSILTMLETAGQWLVMLPSIIFAVIGVVLALFQWLFPISTDAPTASEDHPALMIPQLLEHIVPHLATLAPQHGPSEDKTSYCSIEGFPPPTDPRTIQQREMAVKDVYVQLTQADTTALVLTGIGGVGKSTLAALIYRYAEELRLANKGPFMAPALWLKVDSAAITMHDLSGTLFQALEKPLPDLSNLAAHNQAAVLFNALNTATEPRLIVLDQFENLLDWHTGHALVDSPGIGEWLDVLNSQSCRCRILLTSRPWPQGTRSYPPTYMQEYRVAGLSSTEGCELLQKLGLVATEPELQQAVKYCSGHSYALTLLAALLRKRRVSLGTFFKDPTYGQLWTGDVARNLLDRLYAQQLDELQRQLLLAFSVYRQPVPLEAACAMLEDVEKRRVHLALDALLTEHLLLPCDEELYQLHTIVVSYAQDHFVRAGELVNRQALKNAHRKAAQYYQHCAQDVCPQRTLRRNRNDILPLEEAFWHYCQAEDWAAAYALIEREGIYIDLSSWGYVVVLREMYEMLFPLAKWATAPLHAARMYDELGEVYRVLGLVGQAQYCFEQGLVYARTVHERREEGYALNYLGRIYADQGKWQEALTYYKQALQIHREVKNLGGESTVLDDIGWAYYDVGLLDQACEHYEEALRIRQELKNRKGEARVLNSLSQYPHTEQ